MPLHFSTSKRFKASGFSNKNRSINSSPCLDMGFLNNPNIINNQGPTTSGRSNTIAAGGLELSSELDIEFLINIIDQHFFLRLRRPDSYFPQRLPKMSSCIKLVHLGHHNKSNELTRTTVVLPYLRHRVTFCGDLLRPLFTFSQNNCSSSNKRQFSPSTLSTALCLTDPPTRSA